MDDVWARVALVAGALAVAGLIALWQQRRTRRPVRDLVSVDLEPGVYFFSSATCPTCARARNKLDARLGESGYTETAWEHEPEVFSDIGVDAVPAVLVVTADGEARLYPGQPERALREVQG